MTDDIVLEAMKKNNIPLTRQNYLHIAYLGKSARRNRWGD